MYTHLHLNQSGTNFSLKWGANLQMKSSSNSKYTAASSWSVPLIITPIIMLLQKRDNDVNQHPVTSSEMMWNYDYIYKWFLIQPTVTSGTSFWPRSLLSGGGCVMSISFSFNLQTDGPEVTVYLVLYVYTDGFVNMRCNVSHTHTDTHT